MTSLTNATLDEPDRAGPAALTPVYFALVVVNASVTDWVGSVFLLSAPQSILGRGGFAAEDRAPRLLPVRQRPGRNEAQAPLDTPFISRTQLQLQVQADGVVVENVGRCPLLGPDGERTQRTLLKCNDVVALGRQLLLMLVKRPAILPALRTPVAEPLAAFAQPDSSGFVGESSAAWAYRDEIAWVGQLTAHALVLGPSGSGKEVAARAIHQYSLRCGRALVSRNAATIPATLADAELFGCAANYPNGGMPERAGLLGEAHRSTLFLDEIGELPEAVQTKFLRVLDGDGEYQRLGDPKRRHADVRVVGATNRPLESLREDVAARFKLRITLSPLSERPEDIPLLARHLVLAARKTDPALVRDALVDAGGNPKFSNELMRFLVTRRYQTHVRELERLLLKAIASSTQNEIDLPAEPEAEHAPTPAEDGHAHETAAQVSAASANLKLPSAIANPRPPTPALTEGELRAALARVGGSREKAWRDLGLANRYVLKRLLQKHGIAEEGDTD